MQTKEFEMALRFGGVREIAVCPLGRGTPSMVWVVSVSTGEEREPERLQLTRGGVRTWRTLDAVYSFLAGYLDDTEDVRVNLAW